MDSTARTYKHPVGKVSGGRFTVCGTVGDAQDRRPYKGTRATVVFDETDNEIRLDDPLTSVHFTISLSAVKPRETWPEYYEGRGELIKEGDTAPTKCCFQAVKDEVGTWRVDCIDASFFWCEFVFDGHPLYPLL